MIRSVRRVERDSDPDASVAHVDREGLKRDHRRECKHGPGGHVEDSTVSRTRNTLAVEPTLIERRAVVRADVLDSVDRSTDVAQENGDARCGHTARRSQGHVVHVRARYHVEHLSCAFTELPTRPSGKALIWFAHRLAAMWYAGHPNLRSRGNVLPSHFHTPVAAGAASAVLSKQRRMEFVTAIAPTDMVGIRLIAESNQFAIYSTGDATYLLVHRHAGIPWTGLLLSGDGLFRITGLLVEATRDLYRDVAACLSPANQGELPFESVAIDAAVFNEPPDTAAERNDLYQDDLMEERQISPALRDVLASNLIFDPQ